MSARFALRAATAAAHARLDALMSRFDLADRRAYGAFLRAQAGAFPAVEAALDRAGAGRLLPDWTERRRSQALHDDLAVLALAAPPPLAAPAFATEPAVWGGLYVLEGSRLGGAVLIRSAPSDLPINFLRPGNPAAWRAFVASLDQRLSSPPRIEAAAAAAAEVFEVFESSARRILAEDRP